jgi:hypothetical protein
MDRLECGCGGRIELDVDEKVDSYGCGCVVEDLEDLK